MTASLLGARPGAADQLPPGITPTVEGPTTAAPHWTRTAARLARRLTPWFVRGLMLAAVLAFAGLAIGPHVFGYRTMTMLTESMAPGIEPGDVTVVTPLAVSEVTEGMVISYHIPVDDHRLVTHRIISVEHGTDGSVTVQTKGDANEMADPWTATLQGDTAYQVRAVIPELGHLLQALRTPLVAQALTYGAPALLVGWLLLSIWRPARPAPATADETTDTATDEPATEPALATTEA